MPGVFDASAPNLGTLQFKFNIHPGRHTSNAHRLPRPPTFGLCQMNAVAYLLSTQSYEAIRWPWCWWACWGPRSLREREKSSQPSIADLLFLWSERQAYHGGKKGSTRGDQLHSVAEFVNFGSFRQENNRKQKRKISKSFHHLCLNLAKSRQLSAF
jgi:hypothetical protein